MEVGKATSFLAGISGGSHNLLYISENPLTQVAVNNNNNNNNSLCSHEPRRQTTKIKRAT